MARDGPCVGLEIGAGSAASGRAAQLELHIPQHLEPIGLDGQALVRSDLLAVRDAQDEVRIGKRQVPH